jgi:hypothetical protein
VLSKWFAAALVVALCRTSTAQVANLQIRVVEGDGGIHAPGARSSKPLTVEVTDETGRAVPRAAVSFHLPDDGPGGIFANGLRTDVVTTDDHGRASLRGWQLNHVSGRFQIRITASKEQATAGLISFQYISEPTAGTEANNIGATRGVSHSRLKWLAIVALAGRGVAGAGLVVSRHTASTATTPVLTIGPPAITVGKP